MKTGQAQLFIETPYRNAALFQALLQALQPNTRVALSSGLTLETGVCLSDYVKNWRQTQSPLNNSTPVVFALGR
jgi:16S rRNA (cytidine1402-2'-O)-methyltransferase